MTRVAPRILIPVTNVATGAGGLLALIAMNRMSGGLTVAATPFILWVLAPFVITLWAANRRPVSAMALTAVLVSSGLALVLYFDLAFPRTRPRSTEGLALLFLPLWHLLWVLIALAISLGKSLFVQPGRCESCMKYLRPGENLCGECAKTVRNDTAD
jgi:hypothetical protein